MRYTHNLEKYTNFGVVFYRLCNERQISFNQLAKASGLKDNSAITRVCQGDTKPKRDNLLKWCSILECSNAEQTALLHWWGYATPAEVIAVAQSKVFQE